MAHPADQYGSQGSVPFDTSAAPTGATNARMSEQATPADMGADIGAGVSKVGEAATNLANEYGGMVNNTLANNADSNLAQQIGKIKGDYMSKTGMDAYNSYGSYQAAIEQAYQDNNKGLTLGAQQAYMQQSRRMVDMHLADGSGYAASQLKEANIYSDTQNNSVYQQMALDPNFAKDPAKMGYLEGTVRHLTGSAIDSSHPGLKTDPDTGQVGFDESKPEGQQLKAQYQQNLDANISQLKLNQFTTLARPDVMGAIPTYDLFKQVKDSLPPQAQVGIESYLKPRVFHAEVTDGTNSVINEAKQAHAQMLYNPSSNAPLSVRNNNPGNLRDPSTGQFRVFDTPAKGAQAMQDDLTAKISGDSPAMERNFGKGYSPTLSNVIATWAPASDKNNPKAYTDTVSKETGIAPDQVLTTGDIAKLMPAMAKVESGGSSGGITTQTQTELASYNTTQPAPKYGTNANGAPLTEADYYQAHSGDVLARWHDIAQRNWPGDLAHEKAGDASLRQYMQTAIANQTGQERQDKGALLNAALGTGAPNQKPITSTDQLISDPKMRDLYYKVFERDPKFIETLNNQIITAQSRGDSKDLKEGGEKFYDFYDRAILPPSDKTRPTELEVMHAVGHGLTLAGSKNIIDIMNGKENSNEPFIKSAVETMKDRIVGATGDEHDPETKEKIAGMTFKVRNAVQEGLASGKTIQQLTDPSSKDFAGNAFKNYIPSDLDAARKLLNHTNSSFVPSFLPTPSRFIGKLTGSAFTTDFENNFRDAMKHGTVERPDAEVVLKEAFHKGTISKDVAKQLFTEYGFGKQPLAGAQDGE